MAHARAAARVADRPYTVLSCGISLDGYLDSPTARRLPLSNEADFDRVPGLGANAALVRQHMVDARTRHVEYTHEFGEDMPEVRDWRWTL